MFNKIHELTKILTYSYTPENEVCIDAILNNTIERCEQIYYKTILYPQLETIWKNEKNMRIESEDTCESTCSTPTLTHMCNKLNTNIFKNHNTQYVLKDITVLIYICIATQPASVFSENLVCCH